MFFRIIIPNYNNKEWLEKCVNSVFDQTFKDYELIIVDDCSNDGSTEYLNTLQDKALVFACTNKHYNGGSRNIGIDQFEGQSEYTLFLDSDDWFADKAVLQDLADFIVNNDKPDCIRLPYKFEYDGYKKGQVPLNDDTPKKLVESVFVACWTKCVKSSLIQKFPENTLMEDVVQHIKQCDVLSEVMPFNRPVVVHNRNNRNSISRKENLTLQDGKWQSSMFRYMADLLDLRLEHDYCEKVRQRKVKVCLENIKKGLYTQSG